MAFNTCRRCGYKFVPKEYGSCPKCNASMASSRFIRVLILGGALVSIILGLFVLAMLIGPHVQVTVK